MRRAVFLDRDGTVCEDLGYLDDPSRLSVYPFAAAAVRAINASPLLAVLVTNQSGVARGYFDEEAVRRVHDRLEAELSASGAHLDGIYYCPHHPTEGNPPYVRDCDCRKPRPGMLRHRAEELDIDLPKSYVVGDKYSDVRPAHETGGRAVLVRTGYGRREWEYDRQSWPRQPEHVAETLADAVTWILEDIGKDTA